MVTLNQIGQIALIVDNVDTAEKFYENILGMRKLYRFGNLVFFECDGVRLLIESSQVQPFVPHSSIVYFRISDIGIAYDELKSQGVTFTDAPHLIAQMEDHDLWMVFFNDPAGNSLALMQEAPKGWTYPS